MDIEREPNNQLKGLYRNYVPKLTQFPNFILEIFMGKSNVSRTIGKGGKIMKFLEYILGYFYDNSNEI
jgi:predicted RNA-binding protein YlqC (UPF0109 family)